MSTFPRPQLEIRETLDAGHRLRLTLVGELDMSVTDQLERHVLQFAQSDQPVVLDLSLISFIDVYGLRGLIRVVEALRQPTRNVEVDTEPSASVQRLLRLVGGAKQLWPGSHRLNQRRLRQRLSANRRGSAPRRRAPRPDVHLA